MPKKNGSKMDYVNFIKQICYAEKRTVRDVAEDAKAAVDKAGDAIKDFLSPETWDVSRK